MCYVIGLRLAGLQVLPGMESFALTSTHELVQVLLLDGSPGSPEHAAQVALMAMDHGKAMGIAWSQLSQNLPLLETAWDIVSPTMAAATVSQVSALLQASYNARDSDVSTAFL